MYIWRGRAERTNSETTYSLCKAALTLSQIKAFETSEPKHKEEGGHIRLEHTTTNQSVFSTVENTRDHSKNP
ncbi:Uncharacterized protein HZ326_31590 [Fusarium oxysporum f. sp. albedinis]|nr:Uncharacterized protein HZ326_31590 [Fusarium oxysporum f. sp. albedinis]